MNILTALVITGSQFPHYLLYFVAVVICYIAITWGLKMIPVPEPFDKVLKVLLVAAVVFILVAFAFDIAGHPLIAW